MPNFFDQFDAPAGGNVFDKYDEPASSVPAAIGDIPKEVSKAVVSGVQHLTGNSVSDLPGFDERTRGQLNPIEGWLRTGKQLLAIPELAAAIPAGIARAVGGHVMADLEHQAGTVINPDVASKDDPQKMYEAAAGDVDTAMTAARPAGFLKRMPAPAGRAQVPYEIPEAELSYQHVAPETPTLPGQEVANAAQRLSESGGPVTVPKAVATDSMALQRAAAATRNIPLAGDPLVKSAERTVAQLGDKAGEIAEGYGGANVAGAGETARDAIKNYVTGESAATSKKFYDRVEGLIKPGVKTDLSTTRQAAQSILDRRSNAAITEASGAVKKIEEAITAPGGLNYQGIKDLRSYIGDLKENASILPSDISGKELDRIYSALTTDLKQAVTNAGGPEASSAFARANRHYALLSDRREALAKIVGKDGNAPAEQVFERLVSMASSSGRADISKLAQARKAIGEADWNEFASGVIGRMGRDTANFSGPERLQSDNFSPQRFLTAYGKLSEEGKSVMFRSGGKTELAERLDDIARISTRFKELQKFANPSGTGQTVAGGSLVAGLMTAPLTTIGTVLGGRVMAYALSRPATAASVAKVARAQEMLVRAPSPAKIVAFSLAARNLINTLGSYGQGISPEAFMKALGIGSPQQGQLQPAAAH